MSEQSKLETVEIDGAEIEVRALGYAGVRALIKAGVDVFRAKPEQIMSETVAILDQAYPGEDDQEMLGRLTPMGAIRLSGAVVAATFKAEEKNS